MHAPAELLPGALLDRTVLRYWQKGIRQDLSGRAFWQRVTHYVDWIEGNPRIGSFALIIGHTSPDMMAFFLAMAAAGKLVAYFPPNSPIQDERYYFEQQRHSLASINASVICIFESHLAETVRRIDSQLGDRILEVAPAPYEFPETAGEPRGLTLFRDRLQSAEPLFIQHSSGTTGIKKAVTISGQALKAQFASYWPGIRAAASADVLRIASWLPLYHDMGLIASFLLPVLGGDSISIIDPFEWIARPGSLFEMVERDECHICWLPNFAFRHFVRLRPTLQPHRLDSLRLWVNCSEPCRYPDALQFENTFADWGVRPQSVVGCYAMAETVFAVSHLAPDERRALVVPHAVLPGAEVLAIGGRVVDDRNRSTHPAGQAGNKVVLSSGRALPGLEVAIFNGDAPASEGIYGEIAIRGAFLFPGYRNMSPAQSNIGEGGYYRTGDLGVMLDGHIYIFGRLKEIIIVNGKNIFAGDVESLINRVNGVKKGRVVVFGLDSDLTGSEELIVVAEHDPDADRSPPEVRSAVSRSVSEALLVKVRDVRIVGERWLVKSTSGKISREENRRKYLQSFRAGEASRPAGLT